MPRIGGQAVPRKTLLLVAADSVAIFLALVAATILRLPETAWEHLRKPGTLGRFVVVVVVCGLAFYYNDLYNLQAVRRRSILFVRTLNALGVSCFMLAFLYYTTPQLSLGRGVAAVGAFTILACILGWRLLLDAMGWLSQGSERVLIVGTGPAGISLARDVIQRPELNLKIIGFLDEKGENIGKSLVNPGIVGATEEVESITWRENVDRIVISLAERRGCTPVRQLLALKFAGVHVEDVHSCYERLTGRIPVDNLSPSWLILSEGFKKSRLLLAAKRAIDIVVSLLALVLLLPVMGLVAVAIWLETSGPVLFRQARVGLNGRNFQVLKFRSMYPNAESNGPSWAVEGDNRITRVGRWIRRFRLDELPQLFNVLRGEMSLVGPRPEQPYFCSLLEERIPFFSLRHTMRPGVTGWAQVRYQYSGSIEESKAKLGLDLFYIKHLSLVLDLAIIFETLKVVLLRRGAK